MDEFELMLNNGNPNATGVPASEELELEIEYIEYQAFLDSLDSLGED